MTDPTAHPALSDEYERGNLRGLAGSVEERVHLFSHWDKVLHQRQLHVAAQPHRFDRRLRPLDVEYKSAGATRTIDDDFDRYDVAGLPVIADGAVVHETYRLGIGPETRWHLWSASKSFTGTVLGRALQEGVIDSLDHPVNRFVKVSGDGYGKATLRQVMMMMSSGVNFSHFEGFPDRREMYRQIWTGDRDLDDFAGELGRRVPPGTDFNYLATDTHILSIALRAAYDQPLHQIMQEQLWDPIGMAGDAFWSQHRSGDEGHAFGHACLCPRLLEFAHLGQLYIQDGVWDGRRLLPEGFVAASGTPRQPSHEPSEGERGYGYQWWIPWRSNGESMASGAFGQMIWLDINRGVSIARFQRPGRRRHPEYTRGHRGHARCDASDR
ncbi:MAG: serine hydrolase [Dehalococcoidia bacterium]|jgi:CubicO group peptidase (beta-lactamase class C family)|nr:serine hydrolase [Dehalococcoidia bacterium]